MEDIKKLLENLSTKWDTSKIIDTIEAYKSKLKCKIDDYNDERNKLISDISDIKRDIYRISSEVDLLENKLESNRQKCIKRNTIRNELCKKITEYEQDNDNLFEQLREREMSHKEIEDKIKSGNKPSENLLYLQLMKLSGVSFSEKEGKVIAKIKDKEKGEIREVEVSKIWEYI